MRCMLLRGPSELVVYAFYAVYAVAGLFKIAAVVSSGLSTGLLPVYVVYALAGLFT